MWGWAAPAAVGGPPTVSLMREGLLGAFEPDGWRGYACPFATWTACIDSPFPICARPGSACRRCVSTRGHHRGSITCRGAAAMGGQTVFSLPAGGIFPVTEQFTVPPNTAIVGAANPNGGGDLAVQQVNVSAHSWFVVPAANALCGSDPLCKDESARGPTACSGDPKTHRQGFLMSTNTTLANFSFQGADLGRSASEGTLCGPGAIELPGCLSGTGCDEWGEGANGEGVVENVLVQNVRLSDAVKRAELSQMKGDCARGEALDADGQHVRAHQVSLWVARLPDSETRRHSNVMVEGLVSMNSRADGFNVHGAVDRLTLQSSHIANTGDDCIGVWGTGIERMVVRNTTTANCAVSAGANGENWGSCIGTYAFQSVAVHGLRCFDPFVSTKGCPPRTHWTAIHLNHAFAADCMPTGATISFSGIEYLSSQDPAAPMRRPKCGSCRSCCGRCSFDGFDDLRIDYVDGSVPNGSCTYKIPGC